MITPRKSRILDKLRSGQKVITYKQNTSCPRVTEIAGMIGFDGIWICQEHVPTDHMDMENIIRAAKTQNMDTIVRVAKGSYSDYIRPLEADASAIMIPHLMSLEEALEISHTVRFAPVGLRPLDGGNADGMYCLLPGDEYIKFCNENRMIIVQIEDPEPLSELDRICEIPGIDMIFFGPGDFSQAIGDPGNMDNPELIRVRKYIVETAHKHGKFAGTVCSPSVKECFEMGYDLVNGGADVASLSDSMLSIMDGFKRLNL